MTDTTIASLEAKLREAEARLDEVIAAKDANMLSVQEWADAEIAKAAAREAVMVEALRLAEFGFAHRRCAVCAGFNVGGDGTGEHDRVHTLDCPVGQALSSPSAAASALVTRLADLTRERDEYNAIAATQKQRADDLEASLFIANTALAAARQNARTRDR